MLRQLLIARHAEAGWEGDPETDHERELSRLGRVQAHALAKLLASNHWLPQRIICSSAVRTSTTAGIIHQQLSVVAPVEPHQSLYQGGMSALWNLLADVSSDVSGVLFVGHNPAASHIASRLAGETISMQTATCAVVACTAPSWEEAADARWSLHQVIRPNSHELS